MVDSHTQENEIRFTKFTNKEVLLVNRVFYSRHSRHFSHIGKHTNRYCVCPVLATHYVCHSYKQLCCMGSCGNTKMADNCLELKCLG